MRFSCLSFVKRAALWALGAGVFFVAAGDAVAAMPSGYLPLEYVQSSSVGNTYLDTGLRATLKMRVVCKQQQTSATGGGACGWGSSSNKECFRWGMSSTEFWANVDDDWKQSTMLSSTPDTGVHTFDLCGEHLILDGVETPNAGTYSIASTISGNQDRRMFLFAYRPGWAAGADGYTKGLRIYSCQFYDTVGDVESMTRDFIPAKRLSDGMVGLYDRVDEKFYLPGAGTLEAGPVADGVLVAGSPVEIGTPDPGYGYCMSIEKGARSTFTCPSVYTNDAQTIAARNTGWRLTLADGTSTSGDEHEKSIVYGDETAYSTLTWSWNVDYKVTATAGAGGTVAPAEQWAAHGKTVTLMAVADEENRFTGWTGDGVPAGKANSNPLTFTANAPLALTANFVLEPTYYVATDGDDGADGSKTTPFATIQKAIATATDDITADRAPHCTVLVGEGTFDLTASVKITKPISVTGAGIGKTILRRDPNVASMRLAYLDHAQAVLEQMTLTDGYLTASSDGYGRAAGVLVLKGVLQDAEVTDCGLNHWTDWNKGSCVVLTSSSAKMFRTRIHNNKNANNRGSGMDVNLSGGSLMDSCLIYDNDHSSGGATYGVVVSDGSTMRNCTVVNNRQPSSCAVRVEGNNSYVKDCIVYGNTAGTATAGSYLNEGYQIAYDNVSRIQNCVISDPVFKNAAAGDFSLYPASPLIDAGLYGSSTQTPTDVSGTTARILGAAIDIGAYENDVGTVPAAAITTTVYSGIEGTEITFSLSSVNIDSPTYTVDFGDGTMEAASADTISHAYSKAGNFTVKVSVEGSAKYTMPKTIVIKPKNLYVQEGGTGTPPYGENNPAGYIEDALAEAVDGCTVWLKAGNYTFKADQQVVVDKGVRLVGLPTAEKAVVVSPHTKDKHMMFKMNHTNAGLYNMTIEGGYNNNQNEAFGCNVNIGSLGGTVSNCVIRGGKANGYGGGAPGVRMAAGLVTHCVLSNNNASCANSGKNPSSAITMTGGRLENSLVTKNTGGTYGAPVYVSGSAKVVNCTIAGNTSSGCAGIYFESPNTGDRIINTLVCDNKSTGSTVGTIGIYNDAAYANRFKACVASLLINENCYTAEDLKLAAGYVPLAGSVCRDNGVTSGLSVPEKDLAGNPRIDEDSGKIDIGCYEFTSTGLSVSITADPVAAKGVTPYKMTFTAEVEGGTPTGYRWFEDGVELVGETAATLERTYETAGKHVVSLKVSDGTGEYDAANTIPVTVYPAKLTVDADHSLADAYAAAGDGTLIEVVPGTYQINTLGAAKGVTIRGIGATPADVTFRPKSTGQRLFTLNHVSVRIENLTIAGGYRNLQADPGVGVYIYGQGGVVSNCVIASCTNDGDATGGGGVYLGSAGAVVTHCVITNCTCSRSRALGNSHCGGAGVLLDNGLLAETLIADCRSGEGTSESDGALSIYGGKAVNCTITDCRSGGCAGVRVHGGSVVNTVISGNTTGSTNPTNAVYAGEASVFDTCLSDGEEPINGTCLVEPAERTFKDLARGKFVIKGSSVGRDAGKARADAPSVDLKGRPRLFGKAIDLGCYESQAGGLSVIVR